MPLRTFLRRARLTYTDFVPEETITTHHPKEIPKESSESPHNYLAPFGLDEDGEPTEPPLPGPFRLPARPKHPSTTPSNDAAHIPGPPYGLQHSLQDFLSNKDEGVHGPPPFVVKPTKADLEKKYQFEKGEKAKKPGKVVIGDGDDDLGPLVGPFPLHPPLVGDVYVSQPQNKPLPAPPLADIYHRQHNKPELPDLYHHPGLANHPGQIPPTPTPHDLPYFHFIPQHYHDDPRISANERLHLPPHLNQTGVYYTLNLDFGKFAALYKNTFGSTCSSVIVIVFDSS